MYNKKIELKDKIDMLLKLVDVKFVGIKKDGTLINIGKILKKYGKSELIPEVEKFYLFGFERIKLETKRSIKRNDELNNALEYIEKIESIYEDYKKFLHDMKEIRSEIEKLYINKINGLKLIYVKDIYKIKGMSDILETKKNNLNRNDIIEMLNFCSDCLKTTIYYELKKRDTEELTLEINNEIDKIVKQNANIINFIDNTLINIETVVDISDQMLQDSKTIESFTVGLSKDMGDVIFEYHNLIKLAN